MGVLVCGFFRGRHSVSCHVRDFWLAVAQQLNDTKALALARQVELTKAYQRFVPPQLLSNLNKESILDVQLGDQVNVEMSILFSDIRSFTSISSACHRRKTSVL